MSDLDLASVVRVTTHHPKWTLLDDDEPLTLLHSKFWGKSLIFEEPPRRNSRRDEAQRMDVDDDDDDDVIPGPSILNIDIDGLPFSKIFIRADYIRIYNFLDHREISRFPNGLAPAAVLTGQPGNGEFPLLVQQAERWNSCIHGARREECLGVLYHMPTPCGQKGDHLVSRPDLLSVRQRRRLQSSCEFPVVLLPDIRLDPSGF